MPGPRDYRAGSERALYLLSQGTCYFPSCTEPVIRFIEDVPVSNMHITHICGANPGSARYDSTMTDEQRAAFANLLLTCKPHHDLIDRIDPERFTVSLLREWKADREGDGATALRGINGLTEERLAELLEGAFRASIPQREIMIEIAGAIFHNYSQAISVPLGSWRNILRDNPELSGNQQAVIVTVHNIGYARTSVEDISLSFVFADVKGRRYESPLMGRNDFPAINPCLPKPLQVGAPAVHWLTSLSTLGTLLPFLSTADRVRVRGNARLGSGEIISTEAQPATLIPYDN